MTTGAYGKNEEDKKKIPPFNAGDFRRRAQSLRNARDERGPGGGGGGGPYVPRFRPSTTGYDLVRLIPGQYEVLVGHREDNRIEEMTLEFYPYIEHFHSTIERGSVCSGGPLYFLRAENPEHPEREHREPCKGCDAFFDLMRKNEKTGKTEKGPVSRREMYAFTVIHLAPYHKTGSVDKRTGKPRINTETGEQYTEWVRCTGRGCPMCRAKDEMVSAMQMHWNMGAKHFNMLVGEIAAKVGRACLSCGGKKSIVTEAWLCSKCGEPVINLEDTSLSQADIDKICLNAVCPSKHCQYEGPLNEAFACSECDKPVQATIFDVDLELKRIPDDKTDATTLQMDDFYVRPLPPDLLDLAKPLPLEKIYAPTDLEEQVRIYETRENTTGRAGARPFTQR